MISVVVPVFQAECFLKELVDRLEKVLPTISLDYEVLLIDDGSSDRSWEQIEIFSSNSANIKGIKLSRNFGQHYAITAGLDRAQGDWVVVMDCDLQDKPEEIPRLWCHAQKGYDVVLARRVERQDPWIKKLASKAFYRTLSYLTGSPQDATIANFGIYHQKVISEIVKMRETIRYFPTMVKWVGFKQATLDIDHGARKEGRSNYNLMRLFSLGLDIMLAFSDKPLRLTVKLGLSVAITGFLFAFFTFIKYLNNDIIVAGYASLIISVWVLTGFVLTTLGMVGLYVGKIFDGVKNRPVYIIERTT